MAAAVFAVAATVGVEAIGFALGTTTVWSWSSVIAKAAFVGSADLLMEDGGDTEQEGGHHGMADEHH